MEKYILYTLQICVLFPVVDASMPEYCTSSDVWDDLYCPYGCCGSYFSRYCCSFSSNGGLIAGVVIGSIIGLAIIVSFIVCCVKACTKTGTSGRVVQPRQNQGVFMMNTTSNQGYYPPQTGVLYGHMAQTAFGQPSPAYPNPSAAYPNLSTAYPNPSAAYPNTSAAYPGPPGSGIPSAGPAQYIPPPQG